MLFQLPLGSSNTHSLLGNLPFVYREIGPRDIARLTVLSPCNQTPKPRWSKVNLGESLLAMPSLYLSNPRVPKRRSPRMRPPVLHYISGVPRCHVTSGFRGSRIHDSKVPAAWKPRMPKLRCSGFVPPVPQDRRSRSNRGSHFAISTCMGFLHSPTPIRRCAMEMGPPCTCGQTPSEILEHAPCARSSITSKSVEVFWVLCAHARNSFNLLLLRLATETQFDLHSPARLE
jgi:hypothetical protein